MLEVIKPLTIFVLEVLFWLDDKLNKVIVGGVDNELVVVGCWVVVEVAGEELVLVATVV